jgi:hypothetical protein
VLFGFIAAFAFKAARRVQWESGLAPVPPAIANAARPAATSEAVPPTAAASTSHESVASR